MAGLREDRVKIFNVKVVKTDMTKGTLNFVEIKSPSVFLIHPNKLSTITTKLSGVSSCSGQLLPLLSYFLLPLFLCIFLTSQ